MRFFLVENPSSTSRSFRRKSHTVSAMAFFFNVQILSSQKFMFPRKSSRILYMLSLTKKAIKLGCSEMHLFFLIETLASKAILFVVRKSWPILINDFPHKWILFYTETLTSPTLLKTCIFLSTITNIPSPLKRHGL